MNVVGLEYYELCPMNKKTLDNCLNENWKWVVHIILKASFHDLCSMYVVDAYITLSWRTKRIHSLYLAQC